MGEAQARRGELRVIPGERMLLDNRLIRLGLDDLPDASLLIFDREFRFVMVRGSAVRASGMAPEELEGRHAGAVLDAQRWEFYRPRYEAALRGEVTSEEVTSPDGARIYVVRFGPVRETDGSIVGGSVTATEVTVLRAHERARSEADRRFRLAWESAPIGMALVSLDRVLLEANRAFAAMLGYDDPASLEGRSLTELIDLRDQPTDLDMRAQVLRGDQEWITTEKRLRTRTGDTVWVQHSVGLMRSDTGEPAYFVSQFVDITEAYTARARLHRMATRDALTGLSNRSDLIERAGAWVAAGENVAVLFCDLDGFKRVNDDLGHAVGDEVLRAVAGRLASRVRESDLLARFGGDEFVVVISGADCEHRAARVADHLRTATADPVHVADVSVCVGLSIGIAVVHPDESLDRLLARADAALYRAKNAGGGVRSA